MAQRTINVIEAMTVTQAQGLAGENVEKIKDHDVYFVDLGVDFGFSALVFFGNRQIYHANDYQLHHSNRSVEELKDFYIQALNHKLFTEEEITGPVSSYDDYSRKSNFLHNYYGQREEYVSMFLVGPTKAEEAAHERAIAGRIFDPVSFGYYLPEKQEFVDHHIELLKALNAAKKAMNEDYEYQKGAFLHEMFNREYAYSGTPDYDVLQVFGNIEYAGDGDAALEHYFRQLGFSETRKSAYRAAAKEYWDKAVL